MDENMHSHNFHYFHDTSRQFADAIDENKEYFGAETAVDLGAGGGSFSKLLSKYVRKLYSIDVSDEAIEVMKKNLAGLKNIEVMKADKNTLPFASSSIDLIFAANSFHDLPKGYEKEINRVLKNNGRFIDLDWKKEPTDFGPPQSIRLSEAEVEKKMDMQGLKLVKKVDLGTQYMLIFSKS